MKTENISLSTNEKLSLISNFATLLSAGISILETIDSLLEDAKGNSKKILQALREDVIQGKHVYASFSRFPRAFDKVTVNLIKASEEAGTLDVTLKDLKINIKKEMEFMDRIKSALIYPALIMIVFLGVLLMILIVVVPKISTVFSRLKMDLPLPTKILIFVSNTLLTYTIPVIAFFLIMGFMTAVIYRTNKKLIFNLLFSLPLVSDLIKEIDLTRFCRSLYFLLSSGIPITIALELSQDVIFKKNIAKIIASSREMVSSGKKLSEGLRQARGIIPTIMVKIIEAGEKSGTLDKSLQEVSEYLDYEVSNRLKTITVLLEPIMLVLVGVAVGGMMLAIIAPIYGLIGQVGGR